MYIATLYFFLFLDKLLPVKEMIKGSLCFNDGKLMTDSLKSS